MKPPPPRVRRFTGTTEQGTRVTFERTIERHPLVKRFDFGWLRATYAWIGEQCGPVKVAAPLVAEPWWNQFALPVNHRRFSGLIPASALSTSAVGLMPRIERAAPSATETAATA